MNPDSFDLNAAARVYGIANTPPFLVRKLQVDPVVRETSEKCSAEEILDALRSAVEKDAMREPMTPVEAVRPYAYLVALWFKPEISHLREAAKIPASSYRWFDTIAELCIETFSPIGNQSVNVPGALSSSTISVAASAPTTTPPAIIIAHH
jgi:hypothetical protein